MDTTVFDKPSIDVYTKILDALDVYEDENFPHGQSLEGFKIWTRENRRVEQIAARQQARILDAKTMAVVSPN